MREMADFMAELGKIQDEPAQFCANKKVNAKKMISLCEKDSEMAHVLKQFQHQN